MKKTIKATFRIKEIKRGFITVYQAQIKTRFGWKSFWTNHNGRTYWHHSPSSLSSEQGSIEYYIASKGWESHQVIINQ